MVDADLRCYKEDITETKKARIPSTSYSLSKQTDDDSHPSISELKVSSIKLLRYYILIKMYVRNMYLFKKTSLTSLNCCAYLPPQPKNECNAQL